MLYSQLETDEMSIKKNDYLRTLRDKFRDIVLELDLSEEDDDEIDDSPFSESLPSKAAFIVRRLEECGWIEIEIDPDTFEEYIAIPSYAISF